MTANCTTCQPLTKVLNSSMPREYRQFMVEQKAAQYRATSTRSAMPLTKGVRAIFDPDLGPSGGYRCPQGTQFGGQVTDRFGRNCGRGILRRIGRGLMNAGQRLDNIGQQRDRNRLARAVRRRERPNRVGRAANALERGAQRLVQDYKPGDGGRRNRRNLDGGPASRISVVPRKPKRERLVPDGAERKPRRQGRNPKERQGNARLAVALERAAQRVLGEEDRKPRTRGRSVVEADKPSVKPSVKPRKDGKFDWDALDDNQRKKIQDIANQAEADAADKMRKHMGLSPDDNLDQDKIDRFLERNKRNKKYAEYQNDANKWQDLNTAWIDRPSESINEIDWTPEERQKIQDIFDEKSKKPKSDDKFDWDALTPAQRDAIEEIRYDALGDIEDRRAKYMKMPKEKITGDAFDKFVARERKKGNPDWKKYEADQLKHRQLEVDFNDRPQDAINEIDWTPEERKKIQDIVDRKRNQASVAFDENMDDILRSMRRRAGDDKPSGESDDDFQKLLDNPVELEKFINDGKYREVSDDQFDRLYERAENLNNEGMVINERQMDVLIPEKRKRDRARRGDSKPAQRLSGEDFWERRKNRKPKFSPPPANSKPEVTESILRSVPENEDSNEVDWIDAVPFMENQIRENAENEGVLDALKELYEGNIKEINDSPDKDTPKKVKEAQVYQGLLNLIERNRVAGQNRRARRNQNPTPAPSPTISKPVMRTRKEKKGEGRRLIEALKGKNRREEVVGVFADEPTEPAVIPRPQPIVNNAIKNKAAAVQWVADGKPLMEVPAKYWLDAVAGNPKRYKPQRKIGGAIKGVQIYELLDDDGNGTGTGIVFNWSTGGPIENHGEVIAQNLMHALGMNVAPARWDGYKGKGQQRVAVNAMPFAWNRAPVGEMERPEFAGDNYAARLFQDLPDQGLPQRIGHMLGNFMLQIGDRHTGNGMAAVIDGEAYIAPIDFGFFEFGFQPIDKYASERFWMDSKLFDKARAFLRGMNNDEERNALEKRIVDVYDGLLVRGRAIVGRGRDSFIEDVMAGLEATDQVVRNAVEERAGQQYDKLQLAVKNMFDRRDDVLNSMGIKNWPDLPSLSAPASTPAPRVSSAARSVNPANASVGMRKVLPGLVVAPPRAKNKRAPLLANIDDNEVLPQAKPIVNAKIKTDQDAVKWLDDGNSIDEVPQQFWAYALNMHVNGNSPNKQYMEIVPDTGAIKTVRIYQALDDDGNPTGQGFVIQYEGGAGKMGHRPENNIAEMLAVNLFNAIGLNIEPARFDGDSPDGYPIAVVPFAWNRAPEGRVIVPELDYTPGTYDYDETPNFDPAMFEDLDDKAFPQRLAMLFGNWIIKNGDRHNQNGMGGMVNGVPHIVPIDLGWAGDTGYRDQSLVDYYQGEWDMDYDLFADMKIHFRGLDADEKEQQSEAILNMIDGMAENMRRIVVDGRNKYIENALSFLSPNASDEVKAETRRKAAEFWDMINVAYSNQMGNARAYIEQLMLEGN